MNAFLRIVLVVAAACVLAPQADAQQWRGRHDRGQAPKGQTQYYYYRGGPHGGMSSEQRERLRQEVTSARQGVYRDSGPPPEYDPRRPPQRPMAPAERERLRRDIQNANRDFERRR